MALSNIILLSQIVGNVFAAILSFCIHIPLAKHSQAFGGHCLLFTTGVWREDNGLFEVAWASRFYCNFPIVCAVLLTITSIFQAYGLTQLAIKHEEQSFLGLFLGAFFGIINCVLTLSSAIIITLGFIVWCSHMTQRFPSCEIAAGQNITKEEEHVNTSYFYVEMGTSQFGAWGSFATCVGLLVMALLKLINDHQMRNIKVSMYLERQRLMNEDAYRDSAAEGTSTPPMQTPSRDIFRNANSAATGGVPND